MPKRRDKGEGSVTKRKDGRWEARLSTGTNEEGKRTFRTFYGDTKQEALTKMKEVKLQIDTQIYVEPSKKTVRDWLYTWLDDYKKNQIRPTTYQSYESLFRTHICPAFGNESIQDLKTEKIQKFYKDKMEGGRLDKKEGGLSSRTINYMHTILHEAFEKACKIGLINKNPVEATEPPKKKKTTGKHLTREEQQKLEEVLKEDKWGVACLTALYTGLRLGEILALKWHDIDLENNYINVGHTIKRVKNDKESKIIVQEPKTEKGKRIVSLPKRLRDILIAYRGEDYNNNGIVFKTSSEGYTEPRNMIRAFYKLITKAGIESKNFHSLRHTYASRLIEENVNHKVIQELLGHNSINVTMDIYGHIGKDIKKDAVNKLDNLFEANG